jgi:hypothetical protein
LTFFDKMSAPSSSSSSSSTTRKRARTPAQLAAITAGRKKCRKAGSYRKQLIRKKGKGKHSKQCRGIRDNRIDEADDLSGDSPFLGNVLPEGEARAQIAGRWLMLAKPKPKAIPRGGKNTLEWPASMVADIMDWGHVNPNSAKWVRDVLHRCHEMRKYSAQALLDAIRTRKANS